MKLQQAIALIANFSSGKAALEPVVEGDLSCRLEQQNGSALPQELKLYLDTVCPKEAKVIESVGHPIQLLSCAEISWDMPGFNKNPVTGASIDSWCDEWFLIATEGGDPIIVNLAEDNTESVVYSAMRGPGDWEFCPIADSIGQFLLCALAVEHALNFPGVVEPLDEAFNLSAPAASWLFPLLKEHAGVFYDEWASVFENY